MLVTAATADEEWMELAARDDQLVAQLLLRLCRAVTAPRKSAVELDWTVRQPRSGGPKTKEKDTTMKRKYDKQEESVEPTRASPTTPLSWSGATSTSGVCGADCPEESSRPARPPYYARSKVSVFKAPTNSSTKWPKRKKAIAELRAEESLLLQEGRKLRHELATLRLIVEQERVRNEIFKRKKLDLKMKHAGAIAPRDTRFDCEHLETMPNKRGYIDAATQQDPLADDVFVARKSERREVMFELPDLNVPLEEHYTP